MTLAEQVRRLLVPTHDVAAWHAAVKALDPGAAIPILADILADETEPPAIREQTVAVLGALADERVLASLLAATSAADRGVRARAILVLGTRPALPADAVAAILSAVEDRDAFVRECAAKSLGALRRREALPLLARMAASDPEPANRAVARAAMAEIGS
jgi:HEAT repeat protein